MVAFFILASGVAWIDQPAPCIKMASLIIHPDFGLSHSSLSIRKYFAGRFKGISPKSPRGLPPAGSFVRGAAYDHDRRCPAPRTFAGRPRPTASAEDGEGGNQWVTAVHNKFVPARSGSSQMRRDSLRRQPIGQPGSQPAGSGILKPRKEIPLQPPKPQNFSFQPKYHFFCNSCLELSWH